MVVQLGDLQCCGVREMNRLAYAVHRSRLKQSVRDVWNRGRGNGPNFSHVIFTAVQPSYEGAQDYGEIYRKFIEQHKLGTVAASDAAVNPNSGNEIRVYVWTLDRERIKKYLRIEKEDE